MGSLRVLALVVAVSGASTLPAAEPLPERFYVPSLEPDNSLLVIAAPTKPGDALHAPRRLIVDGVETEAIYPDARPRIHKLDGDRYLVDFDWSGAEDFVWNARQKKLVPMGRRCYGEQVPGLGTVVLRAVKGSWEVVDFPPELESPRVLWRTTQPNPSNPRAVGVWNGALVLGSEGTKLVVLAPGKPPWEIALDLRGYYWHASGDAIRGDHCLVTDGPPISAYDPKSSGRPFTARVALVNLKTKTLTELGRVSLSWTCHGINKPYVDARWIRQAEAPKKPLIGGWPSPWGLVVEETLKLAP